jgi:hypothetical protein
MQNLDIQIPEQDFEIISRLPRLNLIYPSNSPFSQAITADMVIKAVSFDEETFEDMVENQRDPRTLVPQGAKFFEVFYIRECLLRDVTPKEWANNYGPQHPKIYARLHKLKLDTFVKIIALKTPTYSLKTLKNRYGSQ